MKDKFLVGFIAGVIGAMSAAVISIPLYMLKLNKLLLIDYAAILITGKKPQGALEFTFGMLLHWGFSGAAGILFSYLINHEFITNKNLWLKGWMFGLGLWFTINILTTIFKVEGLSVVPVGTAIINALASSLFGIVMALMFNWLNNMKNVTIR